MATGAADCFNGLLGGVRERHHGGFSRPVSRLVSPEFDFAMRQSTLELANVFSGDGGAEGEVEPPQSPEFRDTSETTTRDRGTPFKVERFERR